MLILHNQEYGVELFHEGMIVLTVLGRTDTNNRDMDSMGSRHLLGEHEGHNDQEV